MSKLIHSLTVSLEPLVMIATVMEMIFDAMIRAVCAAIEHRKIQTIPNAKPFRMIPRRGHTNPLSVDAVMG